MDVLTGLAIMSIVMSLVFYLSTTLNGQYAALQTNRLELNHLFTLSNSTICQVRAADQIREIPGGFEWQKDGETIQFILTGNELERRSRFNNQVVCTSVSEMKMTYLDETGLQPDVLSSVHLIVQFEDQELTFHFYKSYSVADRINAQLMHEG